MNKNLAEIAIDAIENLIKYDYHGKPYGEADQSGVYAIMALRDIPTRSTIIDKIKNLSVESGSDKYNDGYHKAIEDVLEILNQHL